MKTYILIFINILCLSHFKVATAQNTVNHNINPDSTTNLCQVRRTPLKIIGDFGDLIFYERGIAEVPELYKKLLDTLANALLAHPYLLCKLSGHTDCKGSIAYNDSLSMQRAKHVVDYLIAKGINRERLQAVGYGEHNLVTDCGCEPDSVGKGKDCDDYEHARNRRVNIHIYHSNEPKDH